MDQIFDRFWNRFFMDIWSVLGAKMGPCWGSFRPRTASGGAPGPSWTKMQNDENSGGGSGGPPGRPGRLPGASGDDSWPKIGPTWPHLGPRNGPKIDEKSAPKSIENLAPFRRRFFTDLGRFLKPKWSQVGSKIEAQTDILFEGRFVDGCTFSLRKTYICVEAQDAEVEEKRSKSRSKIERERGRISRSFFSDFWSIFRPKYSRSPKPIKNR